MVNSNLAPDTTLSHYRIISKIGAGGMGEVYLAEDVTLGRKVALKILPESVIGNEDRMRRFVQEAKSASALNHPNLITIHEIGEADGKHFIASEYIIGETVRQLLYAKELILPQAIRIAEQAAFALSVAHSASVVHRDIKPENIMVRRDGIVKVLDFGLAKLIADKPEINSSDDETKRMFQTAPGVIMGTATYMSPEQARGKPTDARSDIWSLGVVLYEMAAGQLPFEGETITDVIASILKSEPAPLAAHIDEVPPELQRIVRKTLQKNPDDRYQSAKDLQIDLRNLRRELEHQFNYSYEPNSPSQKSLSDGSGTEVAETQIMFADSTQNKRSTRELDIKADTRGGSGGIDPTAVLSTNDLQGRRNFRRPIVVSVIILGLILCGGFAVYRYVLTKASNAQHFEKVSLSRLTNEGNVDLAAISPDGKYIAYMTVEGTVNSFWTLHLATNSRVRIAAPTKVIPFIAPIFSPDGNYVYFPAESETEMGVTDIYRVPVLGGPPRKVFSNVQSGLSFSPDGSRIAFSRYDNARKESSIMTAGSDGNDERMLVTRAMPRFVGGRGVAWSPHGDLIAFDTGEGIGNQDGGIGLIKADGGEILPITTTPWDFVGNLQWMSDQSGLVFAAKIKSAKPTRIWRIGYPDGSVTPITDEISSYDPSSLSLTANGRSVLAVSDQAHWKIAVGQTNNPNGLQNISSTNVSRGATWDSSGKLYYTSLQDGKSEIWQTNANGEGSKTVAESPVVEDLNITPDAKFLILVSDRSGTWQLWRTDANGDNAKQLTDVKAIVPGSSMSPDGKWMLFCTFGGAIWKVPLEGGDPTQISAGTTDNPASPQISPNGKILAYTDGFNGRIVIATYDGQTASPLKRFDVPINFYGLYRWWPDSRSVVYVDTVGKVSNLWKQPIDGGPPKRISDFKSDQIANFSFSPDGKYIAVSRGPVTSDAVLVTDANN